jgi:dienelactone hydrolase
VTRRRLFFGAFSLAPVIRAGPACDPAKPEGYEKLSWPPGPSPKPVFRKGSGPPVVILQELPGLTPEDFELGRRLSGEFTVYLPLLFGKPCDNKPARNLLVGPCWSRDVDCFSKTSTGRIVDWLGVLGKHIDKEHGSRGIGMIGNCLTGAVPLALLGDVNIVAPVLSQPSVPLPCLGISTAATRRALGISPAQLSRAQASTVPIYALRFENDGWSPEERMQQLEKLFGKRLTALRVKPNPPACHHGGKHLHAVLTGSYCDAQGADSKKAYEEVAAFLRRQLKG